MWAESNSNRLNWIDIPNWSQKPDSLFENIWSQAAAGGQVYSPLDYSTILPSYCFLGKRKCGGLLFLDYVRYVRPQRVWFLAILATNRVSILVILGISNRAWFLPPSLELGMFLEEASLLLLSIGQSTKGFYKSVYGVRVWNCLSKSIGEAPD